MSHIIVIFDLSGSMGEPFHVVQRARKRKHLHHEIKIDAAKSALMNWLLESEFDTVTIIPFSSKVERKSTGSLRKNLIRIRNFIYRQTPGGDTNLQAAISRAIKTASKDTRSSYLQYLIVTDGLSHTMEQDIKLVQTIPISQGISGILIDPSPEGESHLRRLCVRGSYTSVTGSRELAKSLERQDKTYAERIKLSKSTIRLSKKREEFAEKLNSAEKQIRKFPRTQRGLEKVTTASMKRIKEVQEKEQAITNKIADQTIDISQIAKGIEEIEQDQAELEAVVDLLAKYDQLLQQLKIYVSHPRFLAKGHTTTLFIRIYPIDSQIKDLNREARKLAAAKRLYNTVLAVGINATIKLESQQIRFSKDVSKKFLRGENILRFSAEPDRLSTPGRHEITLTIYNKQTRKEYITQNFELESVDFAFGRVSRPLLMRWEIVLSGLFSLVVIICSYVGLLNLLIASLLILITGICAIVGLVLYLQYFKMHNIEINSK